MGRRNRERIARIVAGEEAPMSGRNRDRVQKVGVKYLQKQSTSNQVQFLADSLHSGRLSASKLRQALKDNAPKEMHKGAEKLVKKGSAVTVDALMKEIRDDNGFLAVASEVGLDEDWFMGLALSESKLWEDEA